MSVNLISNDFNVAAKPDAVNFTIPQPNDSDALICKFLCDHAANIEQFRQTLAAGEKVQGKLFQDKDGNITKTIIVIYGKRETIAFDNDGKEKRQVSWGSNIFKYDEVAGEFKPIGTLKDFNLSDNMMKNIKNPFETYAAGSIIADLPFMSGGAKETYKGYLKTIKNFRASKDGEGFLEPVALDFDAKCEK